MSYKHFTQQIDADGIALTIWNSPERSINLMTAEVITEIDAIIDAAVANAKIKGVVLTSGKDTFSGGADITMLEHFSKQYAVTLKAKGEAATQEAFFHETRKLSQMYRKLETCGKPFACAINGLCLGGAFELALCCHYRVMGSGDKVRVGLPEIKIGIFPGAGGTQRVSRLMPTGDALQMLFKGELLRATNAKAMNLVHEVAPVEEIVDRAKAWIKNGGKALAPWDEKGYKTPSGRVYSPAGMMIWPPANAIYRRETQDNYPAAKAILQSVYEGLQLPMDQALEVESRYFAVVLRSPEARAMIRSLFVSMGELNKGARRPKDVPPTNLKKIGVLGAGFMGAGIAYVSASAGLEVVLIDRDQASADKGKQHSHDLITAQINRGRAKSADREALLARIHATDDYNALKGCDLVVEAVFETREIKAEATRKAQAVLGDDVVFASNTSTLPITSLAEVYKKPENFIGVHFFSPVAKMMLVEIIMGQKTGDRALAVAMDYVRLIKKTPIVVNDARGFFANRCVMAYLREGHLMLMEGVPAAMIENCARMAGMPVGPLSLNDEVALDLGWKILQATKADLGDAAIDPQQETLLRQLVVEKARFGRKNGKGFYDYPEKAPKKLWPGLAELQPTHLDPDAISVEKLKQRVLVIQALEAARTVEDGIITDPREADVGSILGFGFAPYTGGTLSYIDGMGAAAFVKLCESLSKEFGPRFAPTKLLREMVDKGESFYGRFKPKSA